MYPGNIPLPISNCFLPWVKLLFSTVPELQAASLFSSLHRKLTWKGYSERLEGWGEAHPFLLSAGPEKCFIVPIEDQAMGKRLPDSHHELHKHYFHLAWPFIVLQNDWKYLNRIQHFSGSKNKWGSFKNPHLNFCPSLPFESLYPVEDFLLACIFLLWEIANISADKMVNHRSNIIIKDKDTFYGVKALSSGN